MSSPTADGALPPIGLEADVARRKARLDNWRRHSRLIRLYRKALPGLILGIVLLLGGWMLANTIGWRFANTEAAGGLSIRMVNPKFFGRSDNNSPYEISARSATRSDRDFQQIMLEKPVFVLNANTPVQTSLTADTGVYRDDTRILHLEKNLVVVDRRGYRFTTQRAVIDTRTGAVAGESPVQGAGPLGQIRSSSYSVTSGGEQVFFRGDVHTRIERPAAKR